MTTAVYLHKCNNKNHRAYCINVKLTNIVSTNYKLGLVEQLNLNVIQSALEDQLSLRQKNSSDNSSALYDSLFYYIYCR